MPDHDKGFFCLLDPYTSVRSIFLLQLEACGAESITKACLNHLKTLGIPLDKITAFGSDGAAVMIGKENGVAARLRREVKYDASKICVATGKTESCSDDGLHHDTH